MCMKIEKAMCHVISYIYSLGLYIFKVIIYTLYIIHYTLYIIRKRRRWATVRLGSDATSSGSTEEYATWVMT
jgi:hypothetical protein